MATVMCKKYGELLPALEKAPFPGEAGVEILENISVKAWSEWLNLQTMIINENRLNMMDPDARTFLAEQRNKFLFEGEDIAPPEDFVPNLNG